MIKTTVFEFGRFWDDNAFWGEGHYCEDEIVVDADGKEYGAWGEMSLPNALSNREVIRIHSGNIYDSSGRSICSLDRYFRKWTKQQSVKRLCIEIPINRADEMIAALRSMGGKVVS